MNSMAYQTQIKCPNCGVAIGCTGYTCSSVIRWDKTKISITIGLNISTFFLLKNSSKSLQKCFM